MEMFAIYLPKQVKTLQLTCVCQHQEAKRSLHPLLSKVHVLPTGQIQHLQIPLVGELRRSGTGGRMQKCANHSASSFMPRGWCSRCPVDGYLAWVCYVLEICLWSPVLERWHGVNEIWQSEFSRFWNTSDLGIHQNHFSDFFFFFWWKCKSCENLDFHVLAPEFQM